MIDRKLISRVIYLKKKNIFELSICKKRKEKRGIDKPERWLSSGQTLRERLLCPYGGLNVLGSATQDPR